MLMRLLVGACILALGPIANAQQFVYDSGEPPEGFGLSVFTAAWLAQPFTATDNWQMESLGVFAGGTQPLTMILAQDMSGVPGTELGRWTIEKTDWEPGGSWGYTDASFGFVSGG